MSNSGFIFDIKKFAIHDGPGIRTTVFLKGCVMDCWWCHNPESQNLEPEKIIKVNQLNIHETIDRKVSVDEVLEEVEKDRVFYEESGGGVTFSGGEALTQPEFLYSLLEKSKEKNIHTTLDTTGYVKWEILEKISNMVDLFLYDLKLFDDELHQKYTGVSNKLILENLLKLDANKNKIIIRIPIIPTLTDTEGNLEQLAIFIKNLNFYYSV